jgi:hypothetical protein
MKCQAYRCTAEAMPGSDLCGYHDELNEDAPVKRKAGRGRPRHTDAQKDAKAVANRAYRALHYDYTPVFEVKQRARDAAREVMAEVRAKREARKARV